MGLAFMVYVVLLLPTASMVGDDSDSDAPLTMSAEEVLNQDQMASCETETSSAAPEDDRASITPAASALSGLGASPSTGAGTVVAGGQAAAAPKRPKVGKTGWRSYSNEQQTFCRELRRKFDTEPSSVVGNGLICAAPDPCIAHFGPDFAPGQFTVRSVCLWVPAQIWPSVVPGVPCGLCGKEADIGTGKWAGCPRWVIADPACFLLDTKMYKCVPCNQWFRSTSPGAFSPRQLSPRQLDAGFCGWKPRPTSFFPSYTHGHLSSSPSPSLSLFHRISFSLSSLLSPLTNSLYTTVHFSPLTTLHTLLHIKQILLRASQTCAVFRFPHSWVRVSLCAAFWLRVLLKDGGGTDPLGSPHLYGKHRTTTTTVRC